jgi:hypothetical protein
MARSMVSCILFYSVSMIRGMPDVRKLRKGVRESSGSDNPYRRIGLGQRHCQTGPSFGASETLLQSTSARFSGTATEAGILWLD